MPEQVHDAARADPHLRQQRGDALAPARRAWRNGYVLSGPSLVITVEALPRDFARFTARGMRVLNSVRLAQAP